MGVSASRWALALTAIGSFMVSLDALVVVTALPSIHRELGADLAVLEWTISAYALAFAAWIITAAALGDRYGRRRVFGAGLLTFSAASAACALSSTAGTLIAGRAVQGIGGAMILPVGLTILANAFPAERRGGAVGIWGALGGLGVAAGPLVGGVVTQAFNWHWIFWMNVPVGLIAGLLTMSRITETYGPETRLDLPAVLLVGGGSTAVVWGLIEAGRTGRGAPAVVGALAGGVALLSMFIAWEARAPDPMLPPRLLENRSFRAAITTGFLMFGSLFASAFLVAQYFQIALGYPPRDAGLRMLPWTAMPVFFSPLAGALSDRVGRRPVLALGLFAHGAALAWVAAIATTDARYGPFVAPFLLAGIGISMAFPAAAAAFVSVVAPADIGKASGASSTVTRFGSAFGIAAAAAVFATYGHLENAAAFTQGFRPALGTAAALSLLGSLTALAVSEREP